MELHLKLSKFKLQLGALISSLKQSREKERYASEQYNLLLQRQNETEEKYSRKLNELQAELAASNDLRQKLETKLNYLQNDNELLDNKQKELQGTINRLLQSKENFVKVYEDSTFEMKQTIIHKDNTISALTEKIRLHMSLFSSIEKEASSVKHIVDNAQQVLREKEELVAGLKIKVERATMLGTEFMDKISTLNANLRSNEDELRRKNKIIQDLESQLEAANFSDKGPAAEEELKESILAKEDIIQSLISEKKALHLELSSLQVVIKKIQGFIRHMDEESKKAFSSMMANGECIADRVEEKDRSEQAMESTRENFPHLSDPPQSTQPESTMNILNISFAEAKENYRTSVNQLDSECSTTQPQTS
ncbi:uncharacterized protein LOC108202555 isoform X2 [Daucus carota subsp. sativus]|uniref:uncharacterized protein LOC108202555 isoform X2 n=1 Tax=Daucus carota subsp. sativus TaxID=79200 RepID=UPI0007EF7240|nr:PREDICTED: centrosomal protein of 128 kDa isoform X1 [Daucus carota subsp. sativus]